MMRSPILRYSTAVAAFGAILTVCAFASDAPPKGFADKVHYCNTCHGVSAQGFRGFYPIPRLAGQQPEYIKGQLLAFTQRRRANTIMFSVSHVLSPEMLTALADHFNKLNPKPLGGGAAKLAPEGKVIFNQGVEAKNVPACATCHGETAAGNGEIPRLAGQLNDYVIAKLSNWDKERGQISSQPDASALMEPIAHGLTSDQIKAVAAYVSTLE